jgi:hypothetical protein
VTRTVDRKYTFWLAGYYDDFMSAVALADDLNEPAFKWYSSKSHHGNPINGYATLNPRYKYAWCERGNGASGRFNNAAVSSTIQYTFNNGISDWASLDEIRNNVGKWDGLAQLFYPDTLTNANRQRYDTGLGELGEAYETSTADDDYALKEGYLLFCNGYNSEGKYYATVGSNDSTFGRAQSYQPAYAGASSPPALENEAGMPCSNSTTILSDPDSIFRTHLTGVYSGEILYNDVLNNGIPKAGLVPIESLAGKPFLATEIFYPNVSYAPVLIYDGALNSKTDGDIFTIRMCAFAVDIATPRIKICIGGDGTAYSSGGSTDITYSNFAVEYEIQPIVYQEYTTWSDVDMNTLWDDYDFIFDYTAGTYDVVKNGVSVSTGNTIGNKADGNQFTAADMYGWAIQCKSSYEKTTVLIDRVGLIYPLNDYPLANTVMPPATDFSYSASVNAVSNLNLTLIDDDTDLNLMNLFNESAYADWNLLMFRNNTDRPIWRGSVNSMSYNNSAVSRTPTLKISASDYFTEIDNQLPMWELGQNGEGDTTTQVSYDRSESQNELSMYNFGTSILTAANKTLGFNEVIDGSGNFEKHLDSRMRNRSAHPIQMYLGEDIINGPNDPYDDWDDAITAGHATADAAYRSIHSRWLKDLPKSLWFKHMFSKIKKNAALTGTLVSAFSVGDTTLTLDKYYSQFAGTGGSIEFVDTNGYIDSGIYESATTTISVPNCIVRVYEQRYIATGVSAARTQSFIQNKYGSSPGFRYSIHILIPKSAGGISNYSNKNITISGTNTIYDDNWKCETHLVPMNFTIGPNEININGIDYWVLKLTRVSDGQRWWYSEPIAGYRNNSLRWNTTANANISQSDIGRYYPNVGDSYRLNSEFTGATVKGGQTVLTLPATNFFKREHAIGTTLNVRDLNTTDYKHIWVLWADMRNDGTADADNSYRKNKFGLISPYSGNYELSLGVADDDISVVEERGTFTDLKIGEEVDIWELDAEADPLGGELWSNLTVSSSNYESNSKYHNWENKAGSFILIDTSKFFNLNTTSNNGKTGQVAAGRKEIGDYLVESEGFPILIDNYWVEAPTTYRNLDESASWNANYAYFMNDLTTLATGLEIDDRVIQFTDASVLPTVSNQVGQIISEEKQTIFHYATYNASSDSSDFTSGRTVNINTVSGSAGNGIVTITDATATGYKIGELYRAGHTITISNSTSTPSIDGTYVIQRTTPVDLAVPYATTTTLEIHLDDPSVNIYSASTLTATLTASNTRKLRNAVNLGKSVLNTTAVGEWNGAGYGTGNNNAYYLTYTGVNNTTAENKSKIILDIDPEAQNSYADAVVYGGLANVFPMRLIMSLSGFVENKGSGTWFDSDKFRCAYSDILAQTWLKQAKVYGIPNISTIPLTKNMNTTQDSALDYSGRITSITSPSSGVSTVTTSSAHGLEVGNTVSIIDSDRLGLLGQVKDLVVLAKTSTTFDISNSTIPGSGSWGRWRKATAVDDFGGMNDCRNSSLSNMFSSTQALSGVSSKYSQKQVYSWLMGRDSRPSFRPNYNTNISFDSTNIRATALKTQSVKQFTNVRVFYGGAGLFVDYPEPSLNSTPRWNIISSPEIATNAEALALAKAEYEKTKEAPLTIEAQITKLDAGSNTMYGDKTLMLDGARYGYVADQSRTIPRSYGFTSGVYTDDRAWAWTSLWQGNLFPGMVSALDGRDSDADITSGFIDYDDNYFWYGANSISYAVQVVHIPRNMPKTTEKTAAAGRINADGKLRMVIEVGDGVVHEYGATAINPVFTIRLIDYDWIIGTHEAELASETSVAVDSNGFYEIDIPPTYWGGSADKIILSVNYDYLLAVAKNRCGANTLRNANEYVGSPAFSGLESESLFPLGVRKYADADYWNLRAEWYAPRLHICDDINFIPATQIFYTNSNLNMTNEVMGIRSVNWSQKERQSELVSFTLERDVSRNVQDFAALILPKTGKGKIKTLPGMGGNATGLPATQTGQGYNGSGYAGNPANGAYGAFSRMNVPSNATVGSNLNPSRTGMFRQGADGFNVNADSNLALGSGMLTSNLNKRMKGAMDFNNDSVTGGEFNVLGQKKPSSAPRNNDPESGTDSFTTTSSGDVSTSTSGMSFAGATDATGAYNESATTLRVPPNPRGNVVNVSGRYTLNATGQVAVLFVTVECIETGASQTNTVTLSSATNANITLFRGSVAGADVPNNTIRVTIGRDAGSGSDTAQYSALTLHNIQVAFDTQSVSGSSQSGQLTYGH